MHPALWMQLFQEFGSKHAAAVAAQQSQPLQNAPLTLMQVCNIQNRRTCVACTCCMFRVQRLRIGDLSASRGSLHAIADFEPERQPGACASRLWHRVSESHQPACIPGNAGVSTA